MDDSSNGRAVALYPADPGSNPRSGSVYKVINSYVEKRAKNREKTTSGDYFMSDK